ncbi:MAG: hypothetical protein ACE5E6_05950 [Phycisphaerae bacterium]
MSCSRFDGSRHGLRRLVLVAGIACVLAAMTYCGAPVPFVVVGDGVTGNEPPTMEIVEPATDITRDQGAAFLVRWVDSDRDSSAKISFSVVNTVTSNSVVLVADLEEDDRIGTDNITVGAGASALIPVGTYNLRGVIEDGVNPPVEVFAMTNEGGTQRRVVVTVTEPGAAPPTTPPVVAVAEPAFNLSVAQDDILRVVVQPTDILPADPADAAPFDPDSDVTLFIVLDLDNDPDNDDPVNPDPNKIILLRDQTIQAGATQPITFDIPIDLDTIPPRDTGASYFIRATVDDGTNPRVHRYADGTINVVRLASGLVDLAEIGRMLSGAVFDGFNPAANTGSTISGISDFDADGVDDFVLVAQFGNPRNFGPVGEAYLIYGRDNIRFGSVIPVNSVSDVVSGVLFEAPPIRTRGGRYPGRQVPDADPFTNGITSVSWIRDISGDGRPDLLWGLSHVNGAVETMDFDPSDENISADDTTVTITLALRQGQRSLQIGDGAATTSSYDGVEDTTISSADPTTPFGSDDLAWVDGGLGARKWALIKFTDLLSEIPDLPVNIDFSTINATLTVRVFNTGINGSVHQAFTDFDEQTPFAGFAVAGGEPQPGGPDDADYATEELDTINAEDADTLEIDLTNLVQQLIDREFAAFDDELRLIIVPGTGDDPANEGRIRGSEFTLVPAQRPTLTITYDRLNFLGNEGCFPDALVNNRTDEADEPFSDIYWYGGGMVTVLNSQNRDDTGSPINPLRLENTSIAFEMIGQEGDILLNSEQLDIQAGTITSRASNAFADPLEGEAVEVGRTSGARFVGGMYDNVDHLFTNQQARHGLFGARVAALGDMNQDGLDEIMISAPRNELYLQELVAQLGGAIPPPGTVANSTFSTHLASTFYSGSIVVIPGANYNANLWRDKVGLNLSTSSIPVLDQHRFPPFGKCSNPPIARDLFGPADTFEIFAEGVEDFLGDAQSAGDFNQDGVDDILCGAPFNDRSVSPADQETGAAYIVYGRNLPGNIFLGFAEDPVLRPPMLRIRGVKAGDRIGWRQSTGLDVDGDALDDVFVASPSVDFGGVTRPTCGVDFNGDGVLDATDFDVVAFNACKSQLESPAASLFSDDECKRFDYDNDFDLDDDDQTVLTCLAGGGTTCCDNLVDNGFVGVIFGGVVVDGDRDITKIGTDDLRGAVFFGGSAGDRAGADVSSAGDFNQDGFGDLLIAVPGETRLDTAGRERLGVVYLVFGGTHLINHAFNLDQVGTDQLPGIVFLSPYVKGRPNEAAPDTVAFIGDINNDGFGDIAIGNRGADFIDTSFPQGPDAPGEDPAVGRRSNAGEAYIIYGNNFGTNR